METEKREREKEIERKRRILYEPKRSVSIERLLDYTCQIGIERVMETERATERNREKERDTL